ncbi:MAG: response regulator transcription factor [Muribaculaceae bacterium]|nr:response regulator transcription factor [Muribaculaceae bacterium]
MDTKKRILVVDDEEALCDTLGFNLEAEGYDVDTAYSAEEALARTLSDYDLILLDIMMGEISGTQLARILKSNPATASIPIIFCTAKDSEDDMISGLDLGADDYITKPYSLKALLARVRTVLKRTSATKSKSPDTAATKTAISYMGLTLSPANKTCTVDGSLIKMPRKEFEILLKLLSNRGRIFSRHELITEIWPDEVVVLDRVIDVNITRIRQKIGTYGKHIVTRSGYGYGFIE